VSEYWGSVHETSNFIQGYMCQFIGGVCMRQVTLYRVTCVRVLGKCVGDKLIYTGLHVSEYWGSLHESRNFIQGYMCQSTGGVCMRQVTLYRVTCVRVLGECVGDK